MRTIETIAYNFNELSDNAKENALNEYRCWNDHSWIYDNASESMNAFHKIFNTKIGRQSYYFTIDTSNIDENILNLSGLRLRKYLINNFSYALYKGQYFSITSKKPSFNKHYPNGYFDCKTRYSKIMKENFCVLTGLICDDYLLSPIYKFIDEYSKDIRNNNYVTFEDLLGNCCHSLKQSVDDEINYNNSDDVIAEFFDNNGYEFDEDGKRI
jgi:hypothetical protein